MGSLIYRELYIARKFYITNILVVLLFILLCSLVRLSMLYGNLAVLDEESHGFINTITYYVFTYLVAYGAFSILDDPGVIQSDYRSNWRIFAYSLPVTPAKRVLVKYIIKLGAFCAAMLLSVINGCIVAAFAGRSFGTEQIFNFFLLVNFWLIVDVLRAPMMLRARSEKEFQVSGMAGYFIVIAAIMLPIMAKMTAIGAEVAMATEADDLDSDQQLTMLQERLMDFLKEIHDKVLVWMPLLTIVILAVGFFVCIQMLKRRES
ncbi:MAG: hypothetical protein J1F11_01480 [Oscillospiraceae bacterium]|nr:hypothetical protein [Oscillospiraceae bacterium]